MTSELVDVILRTWTSPSLTPAPATSWLCPSRKIGEPLCDSNRSTATGVWGCPGGSSYSHRASPLCSAQWGPVRPLAANCLGGSLGFRLRVVPPSMRDPRAAPGRWPQPSLSMLLGKLPDGMSVLKPLGRTPASALWKLVIEPTWGARSVHTAPKASPPDLLIQ